VNNWRSGNKWWTPFSHKCQLFMMVCDNTPLCNKQTACSRAHHRGSSVNTSSISNINRRPLLSLIQIQTSTKPISQLTLSTTQILNSLYHDSTHIPLTKCVSELLILPTACNAQRSLRKGSQQPFVIRQKGSWENAERLTISLVIGRFCARVAVTKTARKAKNSRGRGCCYARIMKVA
jgi:hypothetical protein